ncbi:hypothetical protein CONPUDRAFT_166760 [Coniophora puteana RWD-64-598 SS2]|uniref:Uncharacterized protein n=1 Tax=Coniophora puteana (strain RWD-64-598) TaxID=741705 RepID=A0A5M3MI46_CONPW|nr:uncharacterized protein CONPUDRAFT_166760 [Coniophora puteana RWD-64-598 SS2]EIW78882.1 hypothetical protein CONPUDRAFT_166760 [Coniophora puteana RWD-64-598 SS2]
MGSAISSITASQVVFVTLICGALTYRHYLKNPAFQQTVHQAISSGEPSLSSNAGAGTGGRKKKAKKGTDAGAGVEAVEGTKPTIVAFPRVVPGELSPPSDADQTEGDTASASEPAAKTKKAKKKKSKGPAASVTDVATPGAAGTKSSASGEPEKSAAPAAAARPPKGSKSTATPAVAGTSQKTQPKEQQPPPQAYDTDSSWTRVEPSRKSKRTKGKTEGDDDTKQQLGVATDFTTSDTGASGASGAGDSPVTERTDDEFPVVGTSSGVSSENRRTFAEKMLPKPRKTGVDDMLEQSDYPTIARVMKIKPGPGEQPPAGFSWQDYEDVEPISNTGTAQTDGDAGDDEGEWGVVKSKSRTKPSREASTSSAPAAQKAPETMTKKQRQNANRRAAEKTAKADAEAERIARQAQHKRDVERERIIEQAHKSGSGSRSVSGGMSASVDSRGKMVFD